jgi:hypothetical protein
VNQPAFIVKKGRGEYIQATTLRARHTEITKHDYTIGGVMNVMKGTGRYRKDVFTIMAQRASSMFGVKKSGNGLYTTIKWQASALKAVVRRLRPQEAVMLDELDAQIEELDAQLRALRNERAAYCGVAWSNAHVVRLNEIEPETIGEARVLEESDV